MKTSIKVLGLSIIIATLMSCTYSGIKGSKNVIKQKRELTENIEKVKVSTGIDLILTQGSKNSLEVEADDNIVDILKTEVKGDQLNIYFEKNVRNVKSRKVYLTIPSLKSLKTTSGASVECKDGFSGEDIAINASSGSNIDISLNYKHVDCSSSSGSDIDIVGECDNVNLNASSGSDIEAKKLSSNIADVNASSGSDITVLVKQKITANASSGGDIDYYGNPSEKNISKSSGGSVNNNN